MPFSRLAYTTAALALAADGPPNDAPEQDAPEAHACALCGGILGATFHAWEWTDPEDATKEVHHFAAHLPCEYLRKFVFDLSEWEDGENPVLNALFENATRGAGTDEVIIDENLWRRWTAGIHEAERDGLDVLRARFEERVRSQRGEDAPEVRDCDDCAHNTGGRDCEDFPDECSMCTCWDGGEGVAWTTHRCDERTFDLTRSGMGPVEVERG